MRISGRVVKTAMRASGSGTSTSIFWNPRGQDYQPLANARPAPRSSPAGRRVQPYRADYPGDAAGVSSPYPEIREWIVPDAVKRATLDGARPSGHRGNESGAFSLCVREAAPGYAVGLPPGQ